MERMLVTLGGRSRGSKSRLWTIEFSSQTSNGSPYTMGQASELQCSSKDVASGVPGVVIRRACAHNQSHIGKIGWKELMESGWNLKL